MKTVIIPTISELHSSIAQVPATFIVIDEGEHRSYNKNVLSEREASFFGPREREEWFKQRNISKKLRDLIPKKCHAESSFGLLVALEKGADYCFFFDDDVIVNNSILDEHINVLNSETLLAVSSSTHWYNTLRLTDSPRGLHPRGFPFSLRGETPRYTFKTKTGRTILNQGLWTESPDLDSFTILMNGGSIETGVCPIRISTVKNSVALDAATFTTVCSMNLAFRSEIIPAFYQLPMNEFGLDRYDDIWSGLFVKKIADKLGYYTSCGVPACQHSRRPRLLINDFKKELIGFHINEVLWELVLEEDLYSKNYADCYYELAQKLAKKSSVFRGVTRKIFENITSKMKLWTRLIDKIS